MKKIRIIAAVLAVTLAVGLFAGCNKNKTPWQDEARTLVAEKMDDSNVGKFVLDGVSYDFPMAVKDLTDNGWNFASDSVGTKSVSSYAWNPNYVTLKNADNKSIEIAVYNSSEKDATVAESTVGEVRISNLRGHAMISGGIDFYGTTFDANGNLGDHAADGFELVLDEVAGTGNVFTKDFVGSNGKNCTATFYFGEFEGNVILSEVKYECFFKIPFTDAAQAMILSILKNDPATIEAVDSSTDGTEYVTETRKYLAEDFVYSLGFDVGTLSEEQYNKVYKIMDDIYSKIEFTVEDKGYNTLIVFNSPSNLSDVLNAAIQTAADGFEGDLDNATTDAAFLELVLDNFNTADLEFMPGDSVLATSDNFTADVYDVMYYMLGFYDLK